MVVATQRRCGLQADDWGFLVLDANRLKRSNFYQQDVHASPLMSVPSTGGVHRPRALRRKASP